MRSIRRILSQTEPDWALTGKNISLGRAWDGGEWSATKPPPPPTHTYTRAPPVMKRICAGNVFVLLYPSSALFISPPIFLPPNKSFVGAEIRYNFTSKSFSYCHFFKLKVMMHFFYKGSGRALPQSVFAFKRCYADSVTKVWAEVHERWIITPHFILVCKMIMAGPCQAIRWRAVFRRLTAGGC